MIDQNRFLGWEYELMNFKGKELLEELNKLDRLTIIEWLMWNDRNGVYDDQSSLREFGNILSKEEGIEIIQRQIEEG